MRSRPQAIDVTKPAFSERRERLFKASGNSFKAEASVIDLYDEIGTYGVTAKAFRQQLVSAGDSDITLRINSPGGSVFDGIAIYNDLISHKGNVRVEITGVAASIASVIAMAGEERLIASNAHFMIHKAWTVAIGNETELVDLAALLRKIDAGFVATYSARTKIEPTAIAKMLSEETWFNAKEAVSGGFATGELPAAEPKAQFDLTIFAKTPEGLRDAAPRAITTPNNIRDFEFFLRDAGGFSRSQAKALSAGGFPAIADLRDEEALQNLAAHITAQANSISKYDLGLNVS